MSSLTRDMTERFLLPCIAASIIPCQQMIQGGSEVLYNECTLQSLGRHITQGWQQGWVVGPLTLCSSIGRMLSANATTSLPSCTSLASMLRGLRPVTHSHALFSSRDCRLPALGPGAADACAQQSGEQTSSPLLHLARLLCCLCTEKLACAPGCRSSVNTCTSTAFCALPSGSSGTT